MNKEWYLIRIKFAWDSECKMALKSKFVQISKDIINIWANTEPTKAEDEEDGAIHGFIKNRTVFSDTSSGEQFQNHHWTQIQKYLS